jgi:hypothetical protein
VLMFPLLQIRYLNETAPNGIKHNDLMIDKGDLR